MRGAIPSLPQYIFMAWCLVKAQEQLYLYLTNSVNYFSVFQVAVFQQVFLQNFVSITCFLNGNFMLSPSQTPWLDCPNNINWNVKVKVKVNLIWGSGCIALRILDLGTRLVTWHLFYRKLGGPQSRSARDGKEKNSYLCQNSNPGHSTRSLNRYTDWATPIPLFRWTNHELPRYVIFSIP
jgi:hypothetical protein